MKNTPASAASEGHYQPRVSRRMILRGIGATLTLPWLESLVWARGGEAALAAGPPRRWAALVFANGVVPDRWWAKQTPTGIDFSDTLSPLIPHQRDIIFFDNMRLVKNPPFRSAHGSHYANMLSGAPITGPSVEKLATSLDHYMARELGKYTVLPVLNLGCRSDNGNLATINQTTISWSSPTTPIIPESYPRQAFDRLFDVRQKQAEKSILDDVLDQVKWIERDLTAADRSKLAEYTDSVREVEQQIDRAIKNERPPGSWRPTITEPDMARPAEGRPESVPEYMKLMMDLILLAFRMDMTRIATLQFNNDGTNQMKFGFLDGLPNFEHHGLSHHGNQPEKIEYHCRTIQFHVEQLAYFLKRMGEIDEGGQSLLDSSMVLFGTNFIDGNRHDTKSTPLIVAGRGGGTIRGGKVFKAEQESDRPVANIYASMLQRMGMPDTQFGDSEKLFDFMG